MRPADEPLHREFKQAGASFSNATTENLLGYCLERLL